MKIRKETEQNTLPVAVVISALLVYVFHLLRYVHNDIWGSIYTVYYPFLVPVLIAFTVYFRWGKWNVEEKLFLWFWVWVYISRLLNGDFFLTKDADIVLNTGLSYVFLVICIALNRESRERLLDGISILTSGYFTVLGILGVYSWLLHREVYNPLSGEVLFPLEGEILFFVGNGAVYRLMIFSRSSNEVSLWFFLALSLLLYLFLRKKSLWWRISILLAAIPNYLALTVTYSRSVRLAFATCFALLILLVLLDKVPWRRRATRIMAGLACLVVVVPLVYASFSVTAMGMQNLSAQLSSLTLEREDDQNTSGAVLSQRMAGETGVDAAFLMTARGPIAPVDRAETLKVITADARKVPAGIAVPKAKLLSAGKDNRGISDSGRIAIYKSIIPTMQQEPLRLLRGCLCQDVMKISNTVLPKVKPHFHNTFLQLFCLTGLPGLLLILAFCGLLAVRIIRLFFSGAPLAVKSLTLILIGSFIYNMLEVSLFVAADTRAFVAYIVAGAVLAYSYEMREKCV